MEEAIASFEPQDFPSAGSIPDNNLAFGRRGRHPGAVRAEGGISDRNLRCELGYLPPARNVPKVRHAIAAARQNMRIVRTKHCKGWWVVVEKRRPQNPVQVPQPSGAVMRCG